MPRCDRIARQAKPPAPPASPGFTDRCAAIEVGQTSETAYHNAEPIIKTTDLTRRYADLTAVDRLSLEVARGEIFGLVGPDGAARPPRWTNVAEMPRCDRIARQAKPPAPPASPGFTDPCA